MKVHQDAVKSIVDAAQERTEELLDFLAQCETHGEQILIATIAARWSARLGAQRNRLHCNLPAEEPSWHGLFNVDIEIEKTTQNAVHACDILIFVGRYWDHGGTQVFGSVSLQVESDLLSGSSRISEDEEEVREVARNTFSVRARESDVTSNPLSIVTTLEATLNRIAADVLEDYLQAAKVPKLVVGPAR